MIELRRFLSQISFVWSGTFGRFFDKSPRCCKTCVHVRVNVHVCACVCLCVSEVLGVLRKDRKRSIGPRRLRVISESIRVKIPSHLERCGKTVGGVPGATRQWFSQSFFISEVGLGPCGRDSPLSQK